MAKTYTSAEAVKLLNQGKTLTHRTWSKGHYIYKNAIGAIVTPINTTYAVSISDFEHYDCTDTWEIFGETENIFVPAPVEKSSLCCKCGCPDEYYSKGKDGQWYCYKHCAY